jgi:hypothetical protein
MRRAVSSEDSHRPKAGTTTEEDVMDAFACVGPGTACAPADYRIAMRHRRGPETVTAYSAAQLAEIRRQELIADVVCYPHHTSYPHHGSHRHHPGLPRDPARTSHRNSLRRPLSAFQRWLAAGQL